MKVGILTVSDRASSGKYDDSSGPLIRRFVTEKLKWDVSEEGIVPDDSEAISNRIVRWVDDLKLNLIFTTGGTGFAPRDVTPEATRAVIDRDAPGLAEAMRAASLMVTPHAMLSRAVCGIRGSTLIINLPGSPKAVHENLEVIQSVLGHALQLLTDSPDSEVGHQAHKLA